MPLSYSWGLPTRAGRSGPGGSSPSGDAAADWANRISGSDVVWYHNFDTESEVDQFRWHSKVDPPMGSSWGGNDPTSAGTNSDQCIHVASGGADGGGFLRLSYPLGNTFGGCYWWRPFAPFTGSGNGRGVNDPAAGGTITLQSWNPTEGGSQTANWQGSATNPAWYGDSASAAANPTKYHGTSFYLQVRVRRATMPGPPPDAAPYTNITGKFVWFTTTSSSATVQEIVTYGQSASEDVVDVQGRHRMYGGYNFNPFGLGGQHNETDTIDNIDGVSDWRYSGGWDTLLYKITPGPDSGTGGNRGQIEVWAQHDLTLYPAEVGVYTKIWDLVYTNHYETDSTYYPGWNALLLAIYHNGSEFLTEGFTYDYDQVIFSKATIPAPTT